jgi:hypothetical protein
MFIQQWGDVFTASLQGLWVGAVAFVPKLLFALIIFIIGWAIGVVIAKALAQVINALKINKLFASVGAQKMFERAGFRLDVGMFIGEVAKWFVILVFLMASLDVLGLSQVNLFLREVVLGYLPRVFVAAILVVIAALVSDSIKRFVEGGAMAMGLRSARMAGSITKWAIWIFVIIIVLSELGIAPAFMQILFTGIVAMLALAGGLAFGLGGKEAAGRIVEKMKNSVSSHNQ